MKALPAIVDLGIWLVLALVGLAAVTATTYATRPPTRAEAQVTAEQDMLRECHAWGEVRQLPGSLQGPVCQCLVTRALWTNGPANMEDFASCQQRVERLYASAPNVPTSAPTPTDPWEEIEADHAAIRETASLGWTGGLVCTASPPYLAVGGTAVAKVIRRHADPSGEFFASDVPVVVAGGAATLFEDSVVCDAAATEGDGDTCFVPLDAGRLSKLFSSETITVTLSGRALGPVAFAGSPAIEALKSACYRRTAAP